MLLVIKVVVSLEGQLQCLYCCQQFSERPSLKTWYFPDEILGFLSTKGKEMDLAFGNTEI